MANSYLAQAFKAACLAELEALKPGNVHIFADGHGMVVEDFIKSAEAAASVIAEPGLTVGESIRSAVEASWDAVGCNTNLGIVLLCAPLIQAALHDNSETLSNSSFPRRRESRLANQMDSRLRGNDEKGSIQPIFREHLEQVLRELTVADARLAYQVILQANPAGLGESINYDVRNLPEVTLLEAMREAESHDRIAYQYTHGFTDIFDIGVTQYRAALQRWQSPAWAATAVYLKFLAGFNDTHIVRKHGTVVAEQVRDQATLHEQALMAADNPKTCQRGLLEFDAELKARGLNPGTSADLTVASLLAAAIASRDNRGGPRKGKS